MARPPRMSLPLHPGYGDGDAYETSLTTGCRDAGERPMAMTYEVSLTTSGLNGFVP